VVPRLEPSLDNRSLKRFRLGRLLLVISLLGLPAGATWFVAMASLDFSGRQTSIETFCGNTADGDFSASSTGYELNEDGVFIDVSGDKQSTFPVYNSDDATEQLVLHKVYYVTYYHAGFSRDFFHPTQRVIYSLALAPDNIQQSLTGLGCPAG
jgi:hypothetical protein